MKCMICKNEFEKTNSFICDNCYKRYPIKLEAIYIPFDKYDCIIINLNVKHSIAYTYEISRIYLKLKEIFNCEIIYNENLEFENNGLGRLEIVSRLLNNNIIVITNNIL